MKSHTHSRHTRGAALICAVFAAAVCALHFSWVPYQQAELRAQDLLARFGRRAQASPQLVYLAIDSASIEIGANAFADDLAASPALRKMAAGWPWSRDVHAMILDRLMEAGARVVAFDVLFPTPREGDDALRAALDRWRERVVVGGNFVDAQNAAGSSHTLMLPTPELIPDGAWDERVGFVNFWPSEIDGVVREARYRVRASEIFHTPRREDEPVFDSLSARVLRMAGGADRIPAGPRVLRFAPEAAHGGFQPQPVYSIFVPTMWTQNFQNGKFFRDKIVIVGPQGNFLKDQLPTPFGLMDGPELHLNAINEALRGDFIAQPSRAVDIALILGAAAAALALSVFLDRPLVRFEILLGGSALLLVASSVLYDETHTLLSVLSPLLVFNGSGVCALVWQQVLERVESARVRRIFERFVSKDVVREVVENRESYLHQLGGVRKCAAILMTDLRGFTTLTENADSTLLVAQLNEYFTEMVKCVFAANGTLDKFIGDAILAVWGSVHSEGRARDVELAVTTALRMQKSLAQLNPEWRARGWPELEMGIGINFGEVIFGAIGSMEKAEPTVIGDAVNIASRIEGLTKQYGVGVLLGESAAALAAEKFHLQPVDFVRVKGATRPIHVSAALGPRDEPLSGETTAYLQSYEAALGCYRAGDFSKARELFTDCLNIRKNDALAAMYVRRCEELAREQPAAWDGVFVMDAK